MSTLLTTRQVQDLLHVDRTTIYRMIDQGQLPAVKVGGHWRFPREQVEGQLHTTTQPALPAREPEGTSLDVEALLPLDCVQLVQDAFAELLDVMLVVTDLDGRPITQVSHATPLYHLLNKSTLGLTLCQQKWRELGQSPALEPRFAVGFADLLCARALVRTGNELRAMVIAFGIAPEEWQPAHEKVAEFARRLALPPETVEQALESVPVFSEEEQRKVLVSIQRVADIFAHIANERRVLVERLATIATLCTL